MKIIDTIASNLVTHVLKKKLGDSLRVIIKDLVVTGMGDDNTSLISAKISATLSNDDLLRLSQNLQDL